MEVLGCECSEPKDELLAKFSPKETVSIGSSKLKGKIRFMPLQLREFGFHVENHATQWHGFQHEIQFQEIADNLPAVTCCPWLSEHGDSTHIF
jgi:hypothetical protein